MFKKIIFTILVLLISNCFLFPQEKKKLSSKDIIFNVCFLGFFFVATSYEKKVIDNLDGTISYSTVSTNGGNTICGTKSVSISKDITAKLCVQGQVYRKDQNDCKGTGNATNYYGATLMQFCATVNGCNNGNSIPEISCKNEKINNKTLSPLSMDIIYQYGFDASYLNRKDEIPSGSNDFYWTSFRSIPAMNFQKVEQTPINQLNFNYTLCY